MGYFILFLALSAPFVFWCWHEVGKMLDKKGYIDRKDIGLDDK